MLLAVPILCICLVFATAEPNLCAVSNALKVPLNGTCSSSHGMAKGDIAASRGEFEALQVLIEGGAAGAVGVTVNITFTAGTPAGISWTLAYVGFVFCAPTTRYGGSGGGWQPDALMPWPTTGVAVLPAVSLSSWTTFNISTSAVPGIYGGTVTVLVGGSEASSIPFTLTVWPLQLPPVGDPAAFTTIYAYSPSFSLPNETLMAGLDQLAALRFPATQIYMTTPYPVGLRRGSRVLVQACLHFMVVAAGVVLPVPCPTGRTFAGSGRHLIPVVLRGQCQCRSQQQQQ
jgi:hypothetical protein